jgi:hypothetical protein
VGVFKTAKTDGRLPLPLIFIIFFYASSPFLYLIRAILGDEGLVSVVLRSLQPLLILIFLGAIIKLNKPRIPWYWVILLFLGMYAAVVGLVSDNSPFDVLSGLSHFLTGILILTYIYLKRPFKYIDNFMQKLTIFSISSISIVIVIMYALPNFIGVNIYLGLACQVLLVIFFYNFQRKNLIYCILSLCLIIASGKRGVLVALVVGMIISFFPFFIRYHIKTTSKMFVIAFVSGAFLISLNPSLLEKVGEKFVYDESRTVNDYSSGRMVEASSAINYWTSDFTRIVAGAGFGFTYTYINKAPGALDVEGYKNVHFSYLNPLIIFGVAGASIYFSILLFILFKVIINKDSSLSYLKWSCISYFVYACFVFNLFNEPIFWMSLGFMLCQAPMKLVMNKSCQLEA